MADEPQGPQAATTPAPDLSGPSAAPSVPAEPTPTPQPLGGPAVADLSNAIEELRRAKDELAQRAAQAEERAARAEHEANYTRNLVETFRQPATTPAQPASAQVDITDDEFLTNPAKATTKFIRSMFDQEKAERERERQVQYVDQARTKFESGAKLADEKLGRLMAGIGPDVKAQVREAIINRQLDPDAADDEGIWAITAMALRYQRGERNFDKYFTDRPAPMTAPHTETPTATAPPKAEATIPPEVEALLQNSTITREQYLQSLAVERGARAERAR